MSKIVLCVFCVFLLSSCLWFWSTSNLTGLKHLEKTWFSLSVPESWQELSSWEFPTPKVGEVVLALASKKQRNGYVNNLLVLKMDSTLWESSQWLMNNTKVGLTSHLEKFQLLFEKPLNFVDDTQGIVLIYVWKYSKNTPELTYIQTAKSCGTSNYFLTISLAEQLKNYEKYEHLFESFRCEK